MVYLDFYGLKEPPFNVTPDPRFLFFSQRHREAYDHLLYGIVSRKGFIQLTGEVGSGKTTLCRAVLSSLSDNIKTALVLNPAMTGTQLLRAVLRDFGIEVKGRDRLSYIEQLNEFLLQQLEEGTNVALIIDEAQNLEPEVLEQIRLLNNLETDQHKLLQIVMSGQPELEQRLAQGDLRQLRQRIMVKSHLAALNAAETGEYLAHRLRVAGADSYAVFTPGAVKLMHRYSKGIPRVINLIADNAMLAGYVAGCRVMDVREVKRSLSHLELRR
ncbi:MAG: AAA family ATPase [Kiritimatiellae bacterium]|nr:AAA family ATPase [Kiritimatiellia bacterium]